jgi:hypothetical protein
MSETGIDCTYDLSVIDNALSNVNVMNLSTGQMSDLVGLSPRSDSMIGVWSWDMENHISTLMSIARVFRICNLNRISSSCNASVLSFPGYRILVDRRDTDQAKSKGSNPAQRHLSTPPYFILHD